MSEPEITEVFGTPKGAWVLCVHCERCYQVGEFRVMGELQMCPYPDCDGDAVMDAWRWSHVRENHKGYQRIPVRGVAYPLN
jgi:sarcosine oxidase delta subunit